MRGAVLLPAEVPVHEAAARRALGASVTDGVSQDTGAVNGLAAISRHVRFFFPSRRKKKGVNSQALVKAMKIKYVWFVKQTALY